MKERFNYQINWENGGGKTNVAVTATTKEEQMKINSFVGQMIQEVGKNNILPFTVIPAPEEAEVELPDDLEFEVEISGDNPAIHEHLKKLIASKLRVETRAQKLFEKTKEKTGNVGDLIADGLSVAAALTRRLIESLK